jgi:hypothetical protein
MRRNCGDRVGFLFAMDSWFRVEEPEGSAHAVSAGLQHVPKRALQVAVSELESGGILEWRFSSRLSLCDGIIVQG